MENFKVGDVVIVRGNSYNPDTVEKIVRLTKTQIVLEDGRKFTRKSGRQVGCSDWSSFCISKATPEQIKKIQYKQQKEEPVVFLKTVKWKKFDLGFLESIIIAIHNETNK